MERYITGLDRNIKVIIALLSVLVLFQVYDHLSNWWAMNNSVMEESEIEQMLNKIDAVESER